MQEDYKRQLREKDRIIAAQKREIAAAHQNVINMRNNWMQVFDDMDKEHKKALSKAAHSLSEMTERAFKAEASRDQWHDKWKEQQTVLYAALTEISYETLADIFHFNASHINRVFKKNTGTVTPSMPFC